MQRRVAAVYFLLFVVIGAGAFGFIQVGMSQPTVDVAAPVLAENETLTVDGRTYTVSSVGTGGGESPTGELVWTNESAVSTATLANGSTTQYRGQEYRVAIENASGVDSFRLVAVQNASALLAADPAVEDEPITQGGVDYVIYADNQTRGPRVEAYLPEPETVAFEVDDSIRYRTDSGNVTAAVSSVTPGAATLSWTEATTNTIELEEGTNVTLNGVDHFAHFPDAGGVQVLRVDQHYGEYRTDLAKIDYFQERRNGVWGVVILSVLAAIVLLSTAYLPVKG